MNNALLNPADAAWLAETIARNKTKFAGWRMELDATDATDTTDVEDDDTEPVDGPESPEDDLDADGSQDDADEDDEPLGEAGKKALDRMKAKLKEERARRREAESKLAGGEEDEKTHEAIAKANARIVKSEVKAAAKGVLADPQDAYKFLDLDQFEVDDDGNVDEDEIADAIEDLVKKKPYLAAQGGRRFKGGAGGGARKDARPKQLTRSDLKDMSPSEINKARAEGRLNDLLKIN